jgi:hypothetical protein
MVLMKVHMVCALFLYWSFDPKHYPNDDDDDDDDDQHWMITQ